MKTETNYKVDYLEKQAEEIARLNDLVLMRGNTLGRISTAAFSGRDNVTDEQCVRAVEAMRETLDMIGKICRSNKHKNPLSDILCEVNREKRIINEILTPPSPS